MAALTGFRRADGRYGVRNHVLVMPVRASACFAAARIAEGIDGAATVVHQRGRHRARGRRGAGPAHADRTSSPIPTSPRRSWSA